MLRLKYLQTLRWPQGDLWHWILCRDHRHYCCWLHVHCMIRWTLPGLPKELVSFGEAALKCSLLFSSPVRFCGQTPSVFVEAANNLRLNPRTGIHAMEFVGHEQWYRQGKANSLAPIGSSGSCFYVCLRAIFHAEKRYKTSKFEGSCYQVIARICETGDQHHSVRSSNPNILGTGLELCEDTF